MERPRTLHGAGLGLRRPLLGPLQDALAADAQAVDFLEIAPENWIGVGGAAGRALRALTERHAFACHGLSLSLGGPEPLDHALLAQVRRFLDVHGIALYSEHLSWCSDEGHLYDLMPLPFTQEAVRWVARRIREAQDVLGRRIAVENVSYYAAPGRELDEIAFVEAVLAEADCDLLLDVNNVHVNSVNHGYDAAAFIDALPATRVACMHVAGHYVQDADLLVDTHGAPVVDPVWQLLARAYARFGVRPTLLERDFNFPPLAELLAEVRTIRTLQAACARSVRPRAPAAVDRVAAGA
jgi:uncharacterized protein (UPF0276 family)